MKYMNIFLWGYFVDDLAFLCVSSVLGKAWMFKMFWRSVKEKKKNTWTFLVVKKESFDHFNCHNMTPFYLPFTVLFFRHFEFVLWEWFFSLFMKGGLL